jgi:cell division protein FtsQ
VSRRPPDGPRRRHRLAWSLALVVLAAATLVAAGEWAARSPFFRVRHVTVTGLTHESTAAVLAATGLDADPPMIDVSAASLERSLAGFAWIGSVRVAKHWPNTLDVAVTERVAVAVAFDAARRLEYVDATGRDLGPAPTGANLPTLDYLHPRPGSWPYQTSGRSAALVASRLPPAFSAQVSVITEDVRGTVALKLTTPVTFVLGPATDLRAKFVSIASVIAHETLSPGDVVNVSVPGSLAVTGPAPG